MANRICEKCGYSLGYNMKFCPICGTAAPVLSTEYSSEPQQHSQPQLFPDTALYPKPIKVIQENEQKKKRIKPWLLTTIICSAIVVTVTLGLAIVLFVDDTINFTINSNNTSEYGYEYTIGYIDDGYYVNEWANITFDTNHFYSNNKPNLYKTYEHNPGEIGGMQFAFVSLTTNKRNYDFILEFENVGRNFDEEDYIELMSIRFHDLYGENATIELSEREIAGKTYTVAKLAGTFIKKYICVRIQDEYAICFITDSNSYNELNYIEKAISA